ESAAAIFNAIAVQQAAWSDNLQIVPLLRDALRAASTNPAFRTLLGEQVASLRPLEDSSLSGKLRFLQLKSLVLGNEELSMWMASFLPHASAEQAYLAYQLLCELGAFPP